MRYLLPFLFVSSLILSGKVQGQCLGNTSWVGGLPASGTLTATGLILGTVQVNVSSQGTFASGRPGYGIGSDIYGGFNYESLLTFRGAQFCFRNLHFFRLTNPLGCNLYSSQG